MLDKIRRHVRQLEKAHKIRMKPKSQAGTKWAVPGNPNGGGPDADSIEEEEELSPEFIKRFIQLKWECVLQCTFPKPLLYKQLKEDLSMHQIVTTL
jgi:hypothetical protein